MDVVGSEGDRFILEGSHCCLSGGVNCFLGGFLTGRAGSLPNVYPFMDSNFHDSIGVNGNAAFDVSPLLNWRELDWALAVEVRSFSSLGQRLSDPFCEVLLMGDELVVGCFIGFIVSFFDPLADDFLGGEFVVDELAPRAPPFGERGSFGVVKSRINVSGYVEGKGAERDGGLVRCLSVG